MAQTLNWGIIGTGNIAKKFAAGVAHSRTGKLTAVGSRSLEKAEAFAAEQGVAKAHGSYEDLLADADVEAVYISTPHPMHPKWSIRAAEAGKHVLCEKPAGLNQHQVLAMIEAARLNDVFWMEAFMYRCHPQTRRLVELIRDGRIGEVRVIKATFSFQGPDDPQHRLLNPDLGGGGILDVGGYPVSMARLLAGAAIGSDFAEPTDLRGAGHLGATGVDLWASAVATFPGDILAELSTGVGVRQDNTVEVYGTKGFIRMPWPWIPAREGGSCSFQVHEHGADEPEEVVTETDQWLYGLEADHVAEHLDRREAPAMSWADSLGNIRAMDAWREQIGLVYPAETPERVEVVHGGPLKVRESGGLPHGRLPGVEKDIARLVMGVDNQKTIAHAAVMFDDFFECGGNCFDTAYVYGGGQCERVMGQWLQRRGVRDDVVLISKGAHTPHCTPEGFQRQLAESLDRLRTDRVDIYMLHRDNPETPVGEFVDAVNREMAAGRIGAWGGSNWTPARVDAANAYAESRGLRPMAVVSNNFSLARMVEPVWAGCIASSDDDVRQWHERTGMPLMPWSAQARGFFVRAERGFTDDEQLVRCWYSDENFERLARARDLAEKKGVSPLNIALAYVLCQPFPTFPLIGPRTPEELHTSLPALDVQLTPEEVRWLDLRR